MCMCRVFISSVPSSWLICHIFTVPFIVTGSTYFNLISGRQRWVSPHIHLDNFSVHVLLLNCVCVVRIIKCVHIKMKTKAKAYQFHWMNDFKCWMLFDSRNIYRFHLNFLYGSTRNFSISLLNVFYFFWPTNSELNELRKPTSDNPEILRFFKYMRAARDGQDGKNCHTIYKKCSSFTDTEQPAMLTTFNDINKLVQARKLH